MLGDLIREKRFSRGLSLDIVSSELMISTMILKAYENNSLIPPPEEMKLLSCYIGFRIPDYYKKLYLLQEGKEDDNKKQK